MAMVIPLCGGGLISSSLIGRPQKSPHAAGLSNLAVYSGSGNADSPLSDSALSQFPIGFPPITESTTNAEVDSLGSLLSRSSKND